MIKILCTRWGGTLGFAQSYLKENGKEVSFATMEEAMRRAADLEKGMNGPYSTARFTYRAVEEEAE